MKPTGLPASSAAVTTVTPVIKEPNAARSSRRSNLSILVTLSPSSRASTRTQHYRSVVASASVASPWRTTRDVGPQLFCTGGLGVPHEHFKRTPLKYLKKTYRVRNWRDDEADLCARGTLTAWMSCIDGKLVNWDASRPANRKPARQRNRNITERARLGNCNWHTESGYSKQSKVETTFYRYKSLVGSAMRARGLAAQAESRIGRKILNTITALGLPDGERIESLEVVAKRTFGLNCRCAPTFR